jgi:hypothetical protein
MTDKDTALSLEQTLRLALEALTDALNKPMWNRVQMEAAITAIKATLANEALERKAENARELGLDYEPYGFEASIYSNARMKVDSVTGNVSIGTVKKPCGLECDCTDVCKQDDYKALWQQMCERCDELDKKLAQRKPLTDEEIYKIANDLFYSNGPCDTIAMCRAIEAAHGIIDPTDLKGKHDA